MTTCASCEFYTGGGNGWYGSCGIVLPPWTLKQLFPDNDGYPFNTGVRSDDTCSFHRPRVVEAGQDDGGDRSSVR